MHSLVVAVAAIVALLLTSIIYQRARARGPSFGLLSSDVFVLSLVIYCFGAVWVYIGHPTDNATALLTISLSSAISAGLVGAVVAIGFQKKLAPMTWQTYIERMRRQPALVGSIFALFLIVICAWAAVYYVRALGGFETLRYLIFSDGGGLLEVRKSITTGREGYLAPGYIKQIRDLALPTVCLALWLWGVKEWHRKVGVFGIGVALSSMLLSGQRAPVVYLLVSAVAAYELRSARKRSLRFYAAAIFGGVVLIASLNVLLGRLDDDQSLLALVGTSVLGLIERAITVAPAENVKTAILWLEISSETGAIWFSDLASILPGTQSGLSTKFHMMLGGSEYGNSPLAFSPFHWVSFGVLGVTLVPSIIIIILCVFDRLTFYLQASYCITGRLVVLPMAAFWYTPSLFLLYGGVMFMFAAGIGGVKLLVARSRGSSHVI